MEKEQQTFPQRINEYNSLAHFIANTCVRNNTLLEDLHAGTYPITRTGDYTDVKIIDAIGNEIQWPDLSHISDDDMRFFNKQVVNNIFSVLFLLKDITLLAPVLNRATLPKKWDYAELNGGLLKAILAFAAMAEDSQMDKATMEDIISTINQKMSEFTK